MTFQTFQKCIALYHLCENTQPLCLHNFGEVLLHPQLPTFIRHANDHGVKIRFFTNGVNASKEPYTREHWQHLADQGLEEIHFSAHQISLGNFREIVDGVVRINLTWEPKPARIMGWPDRELLH